MNEKSVQINVIVVINPLICQQMKDTKRENYMFFSIYMAEAF